MATTERVDWNQFETLKRIRLSEALEYLRGIGRKEEKKGSINTPGVMRSQSPWQLMDEDNKRIMKETEETKSEV